MTLHTDKQRRIEAVKAACMVISGLFFTIAICGFFFFSQIRLMV